MSPRSPIMSLVLLSYPCLHPENVLPSSLALYGDDQTISRPVLFTCNSKQGEKVWMRASLASRGHIFARSLNVIS